MGELFPALSMTLHPLERLWPRLAASLKTRAWYDPARRAFWGDPDRLMAAKATFAIGCLALPMVLIGRPFFAVSLALGALAGALSETDDHPKGRVKSMALKVVAFGISSLSASVLQPYPVLLGLGLSSSTIIFLLIGGLNERYRGVTFGAILVGIYAMIGASISPAWYWQPILLPLGALIYGLFSLLLLRLHPWRPLEEQLARGYLALARYMELKSALFPSDEQTQARVRSELALQNVKVVTALDQCRDVLNSYRESLPNDEPLKPYLRYFMLLQSLHERAASSHERYHLLSDDPAKHEILEGLGQLLQQLAQAARQFASSLLTGVQYHHPVSIEWLVEVLGDRLAQNRTAADSPLALLFRNLERSHHALRHLRDDLSRAAAPQLASDPRTLRQRFLDQLTWVNPRMRYAVRLSLCFLIGFAIAKLTGVRKGEWIILTSLFVLQASYSETRRRLFQRMLGTFTGVVGGVLIVQLLPTTMGELLFLLFSAFFFFFWLKRNYSTSVVFITTFVLCAFNLVSHQGVNLMVPRLLDTLIGSVLAYLSVRLLWPAWQHQRLPALIDTALHKNADYLRAVVAEYRRASIDDDLPYRVARRAAHRADNSLALAWQDMQLEPRNRRRLLEQTFELTYLNHALLSYISAFGAHRQPPGEATAELPPLVHAVQRALDEAADSLRPGTGDAHEDVQALLEAIRDAARAAPQNFSRHQFTLLYNIADVAHQIMQLTPQVRAQR